MRWTLPGGALANGDFDYDWISQIITIQDPITGKARIIFGHDEGITSYVPEASGAPEQIIGFGQDYQIQGDGAVHNDLQITSKRNGNLQTARMYLGGYRSKPPGGGPLQRFVVRRRPAPSRRSAFDQGHPWHWLRRLEGNQPDRSRQLRRGRPDRRWHRLCPPPNQRPADQNRLLPSLFERQCPDQPDERPVPERHHRPDRLRPVGQHGPRLCCQLDRR